MKPLKLSIGIRPSRAMFRFSTLSGTLIDELLASSERSKTHKRMFQHVEQDSAKSHFRLVGDGYSLFAGVHDVQYSVDNYESKKILDIDIEIERFIALFTVVNSTLKIRDIRRIGMVCEYRLPSNTELPSKELIEKFTRFTPDGFPAKFNLQFEQRFPITSVTGVPDFRTDDFWNVIESFYDGEADAEHSASKQINMMLDVQRYYRPLLEDKVDGAIRAVAEKFGKHFPKLNEKAKILGIDNGR